MMSTTLEATTTTGPQARHPQANRPIDTTRPICSPWVDARRPSTAAEERRFRDRLFDMSSPAPVHEVRRADITALLTALRSGLDVEQLLARAPGLRPARLATAYDLLDSRRAASVSAWQSIVASTSADALDEHGDLAAMLVPRAVALLIAARRLGADSYARTLDELGHATRVAARTADDLEARYATLARDDDQSAATVGGLLCAPDGSAMAERFDYLAARVMMLSSMRVAALLDGVDELRTT